MAIFILLLLRKQEMEVATAYVLYEWFRDTSW